MNTKGIIQMKQELFTGTIGTEKYSRSTQGTLRLHFTI